MKIHLRHSLTLLLCLTAFSLLSQNQPVTSASAEKDVRPGINNEFLKPDLKVPDWVQRFERKGREVFDKRAAIMKALDVKPGTDVADIGAGTGLFTMLMAKATGPNGTVYAVDIATNFLSYIDERAKGAGLSNVKTVLGTEHSVELPAGSIDLAFLSDVYHHFEYPQASLASIRKALRPEGEIVLVEFRREPGKSSPWILNHVRAGEETVTAEIEKAGFEKVKEYDVLTENYMVRFRKK